MQRIVQSFLAGEWHGRDADKALNSAISGELIAHTAQPVFDVSDALTYGRSVGKASLDALDFQQRAGILRALGKYLTEHKASLYEQSALTGATQVDSWIDIDGGIATLFAYSSMAVAGLPSGNVWHEGPVMPLGKSGAFVGSHILVPRLGIAAHINAFNFPVWGMLEKFAPAFLAGMPCLVKPATVTSYLTESCMRLIEQSALLPAGALQLLVGSPRPLLDGLDSQDVLTFTGSADTALTLRSNRQLLARSVPINVEADSLNCAILAPDVGSDDAEFDLFVDEVVKEMTIKAGQKCTAIRRIFVPSIRLQEVADRIQARLANVIVGDPAHESVTMGALVSRDQLDDVTGRVAQLGDDAELLFGGGPVDNAVGANTANGAFFQPTLLLHDKPNSESAAHRVEAFGPVSTLMPYDDIEQAIGLAACGRGSLVGSVITRTPSIAAQIVTKAAPWHGRLHVLDASCAKESTGHGSPLPMLKHGGPGRAGGGEELGGLRAVSHYMQRSAVQGSPSMVAAITGEYVRGAALRESDVHPFRKYFDDLQIGDSLLTHRRTVSEADIVNFGCLSGDFFYMHFDELAARDSQFGKRIAHGYFILSAAAGLFVSPSPGPVLANYGLENLRFVKPVGIGDTIQARLTCKRKVAKAKRPKDKQGQGVVGWDVQVSNQDGDLVASYEILTLVLMRE